MEFDAFTGGVDYGGLRTQTDIRLLVCYLLATLNAPFTKTDMVNIMRENELANYFEVTDALQALAKLDDIHCEIGEDEEEIYTITDKGREIIKSLDVALPLSVREKAVKAAVLMMTYAKNERENLVEINKTGAGFEVVFHIRDNTVELMKLSLYAPDYHQAKLLKRNFHRDPAAVYRLLLASLTGDKDLAYNIFSDVTAKTE